MSKPIPREYPIGNLLDMAKIPEDRVPAFLEEMPKILRHMRAFLELQKSIPPEHAKATLKAATWVDDGKPAETVTNIKIISGKPAPKQL